MHNLAKLFHGRIVLCHSLQVTNIIPIRVLLSKVGYTVLIGGLEPHLDGVRVP